MEFPQFDRKKLYIRNLSERVNKLSVEKILILPGTKPSIENIETIRLIEESAERIINARKNNKPVVMAFGAHVIKNGLALVINEMIKKGWITHIAGNGAVSIHDWEFSFAGETSEDVRENVRNGCFGIWEETGKCINLALLTGAYYGYGYGEAVGKMILHEGLEIPGPQLLEQEVCNLLYDNCGKAAAAADLLGIIKSEQLQTGFMHIPHRWKKYSVLCAAAELNIPFTIHPMFGHDIIYTHPLNHGAAIGRTALTDFLRFVHSISNIDGGVYLSVGSAIMSPMIFEKALSMAQNIAIQENRHIDNHFIAVVDLAKSDWDWLRNGEPPSDNPAYYMRYNKTFSRMGGTMRYITADNRDFLTGLYNCLSEHNNYSLLA